MTDAATLVDSHTRAELDQIAAEAGVENPQALDTKQDVADAIVAAKPHDKPADDDGVPLDDDDPGDPYGSPSAQGDELDALQAQLPAGWTIVNAPKAGVDGHFTAEKTLESLGLQKVSEGADSIEGLSAACEAYDAHLARVAEGDIPTTSGASPVPA